ncbi:hypothetical protein FGADI_3882 [Fusarium gaditjirri]|uniref:Uncharacterized protein n=1 Tax=Fusarium gaditjirri TaxID=282569 RepID=A0A8H4TE23_9HYPO|nr:hypothetical protein FGADI_3882 [Fusarium gaditjirri]
MELVPVTPKENTPGSTPVQLDESQRLLHEAECTIASLNGARDVIAAQNTEYKREIYQLRDEMAILRLKNARNNNESIRGGNMARGLMEVAERGARHQLERQNSEPLEQSQVLRALHLGKEDNHGGWRPQENSWDYNNRQGSLIFQLLNALKPYLKPENNFYVALRVPVKRLAEDLGRARKLRISLSDSEIESNFTAWANGSLPQP